MDTPGLKKAMTTLEFLSQDKEARMLYEARKKALLDEQSALDYVESRGREEGRLEGKAERDKEVVAGMLQEGLSVSVISRITGLSEAEIEELGKQVH
ncbi:hypothetical protein GCM10008018_59020 [Paenibacillus marchantiophytorum]|uniref:Rpn family recombination-promoting nuclease/putative transposase n=2 Tax=Paenibacillus marchantiophytorum TaxID=1619310 RepID=A0ABQ1FAV7_9BACL|nr:hypothetical protein GCM10008018_59020 [Paenibacillus marchantiophytorum]